MLVDGSNVEGVLVLLWLALALGLGLGLCLVDDGLLLLLLLDWDGGYVAGENEFEDFKRVGVLWCGGCYA